MIVEQTWVTLAVYLAAASIMMFTLFFLPAIIELRTPKDAGPRPLFDNTLTTVTLGLLGLTLFDIEETQELAHQFPTKNAVCLLSISNMEF